MFESYGVFTSLLTSKVWVNFSQFGTPYGNYFNLNVRKQPHVDVPAKRPWSATLFKSYQASIFSVNFSKMSRHHGRKIVSITVSQTTLLAIHCKCMKS